MSNLIDAKENIQIQLGINAAFLHTIQAMAMVVATKLPAAERKSFHEMLISLSEDETCVGDLTPLGKRAFEAVIQQVTNATALLITK